MPSSRTLLDGNIPLVDVAPLRDDFRCTSSGLGLVFRSRQDFACKNVDSPSGYDVNEPAASLMLRCGSCDCFIVCCRWCDACTNCCYCDVCPVSMRYPCLTAKLLLATSLRPNTWENPARRTKEILTILRRSRWICNGAATRSPSKRFPRYYYFEGT